MKYAAIITLCMLNYSYAAEFSNKQEHYTARSEGEFVESHTFSDLASGLAQLDCKSKSILVTKNSTLNANIIRDLSGLNVVITKGVTLSLSGINHITFNLSVEDGGQVRVDQDCSIDGTVTSAGNTCRITAFDGNKTLTINKHLIAGRWQIFGSSLKIKGDAVLDAVYPEWWYNEGSDWSDAIRSAIDFVGQYRNKSVPTICFTSRIYNVSRPIIIINSGTRLVGTGRGRAAGSSTEIYGGTALVYTGDSNSEKKGLIIIDGKKNNCRNILIKDISFICQEKISGITGEYTNISQFTNIYIDRPIVGMSFENGSYSNLIDSVEVYDPTIGGMDFRANCHSVTVSNCIFNGNRKHSNKPSFGIRIAKVANCSDMSIFGCSFDFFRVAHHVILQNNDCKGFNFIGNYIEVREDGVSDSALTLTNGSGVNIAGNRFTSASKISKYNIVLGSDCESVSITGNYFSGAKVVACVKVAAGCKNVFVAGNENASKTKLIDNQNTRVEDQNTCYIENGDIHADSVTSAELIIPDSGEVLIVNGAIKISGSRHSISADNKSLANELIKIEGGRDGQILLLRSARKDPKIVLVKSKMPGLGSIMLTSDTFEMNDPQDSIMLMNICGCWQEISRSDNR